MKTPVLVVFFNRPSLVMKVLDQLSEVKPVKIYLSCDGPRSSVDGEANLVSELRRTVLAVIDWECEIYTKFSELNLGCKYNVSTSVAWFFQNENEGIVLEDDCVPSLEFFPFATEFLEYYKNDKRVGTISGRNEVFEQTKATAPYYFSRKFFCWGWASWSDRILDNDVEVGLQRKVSKAVLQGLPFKEWLLVRGMIGLIQSKQVNSWAYPFDLSFREKGQLCLIPGKNLVQNIGFDTVGTHSRGGVKDKLSIADSFYVNPSSEVDVVSNIEFMDAFIKKRHPNILKLLALSMARYLGPIRRRLVRR